MGTAGQAGGHSDVCAPPAHPHPDLHAGALGVDALPCGGHRPAGVARVPPVREHRHLSGRRDRAVQVSRGSPVPASHYIAGDSDDCHRPPARPLAGVWQRAKDRRGVPGLVLSHRHQHRHGSQSRRSGPPVSRAWAVSNAVAGTVQGPVPERAPLSVRWVSRVDYPLVDRRRRRGVRERGSGAGLSDPDRGGAPVDRASLRVDRAVGPGRDRALQPGADPGALHPAPVRPPRPGRDRPARRAPVGRGPLRTGPRARHGRQVLPGPRQDHGRRGGRRPAGPLPLPGDPAAEGRARADAVPRPGRGRPPGRGDRPALPRPWSCSAPTAACASGSWPACGAVA